MEKGNGPQSALRHPMQHFLRGVSVGEADWTRVHLPPTRTSSATCIQRRNLKGS
ncbi:hypothetical protein AHAS_Ahas15G0330200 [Arachis hypogaea]